MLMKSLASTAPSSPNLEAQQHTAEEKTQSLPPLPTSTARDLRDVRDRYRPLPGATRRTASGGGGGSGHTPNVHAFISTPGGSFSILQHPLSHYAATGQASPDPASLTRTGGGIYGTANGAMSGSGQLTGGTGRTRELGFNPRRYNRTNYASTGPERFRGGVEHKCPQTACTGRWEQRSDTDVLAVCPTCGYRCCVACDVPWHDGQTCEQAQTARRRALEWEVEMEMARQQMVTQQRRMPPHWGTNNTAPTAVDAPGGMAGVAESTEEPTH